MKSSEAFEYVGASHMQQLQAAMAGAAAVRKPIQVSLQQSFKPS